THVRLYLPSYRLQVVNGRYASCLKWRSDQDDPNGPLAFLTLVVEAVPPQSGGFTVREIPHEIAARIGYEMPIQEHRGDGGQPAGSTGLGPALWIEVGALQLVGSGVRRARLSISSKPDFDRLYQVLTDSNFKSTLELRSFATAGRRTWRQVVLGGLGLTTQAVALKEKQVFYADVANKKVPEGSVAPIGP